MNNNTNSYDEYIDYSCSTSLERLARDIETVLRSWHVVDGCDRHVSVVVNADHNNTKGGQQLTAKTLVSSRSLPQKSAAPTSPTRGLPALVSNRTHQQQQQQYPKQVSISKSTHSSTSVASNRSQPRPKSNSMRRDESSNSMMSASGSASVSSTCTAGNNNNSNTPNSLLIRSETISWQAALITDPESEDTAASLNSNSPNRIHAQIELELTLWDAPHSTNNTAQRWKSSSQRHKNTTNNLESINTTDLPFSLQHDASRMEQLPPDLFANFSYLFGIGQHITLSPKHPPAPPQLACLNDAVSVASTSVASVPSTAINMEEDLDEATFLFSTLLSSLQARHGGSNLRVARNLAHTVLSGWLQTALNVAATNSQCAFPVIGVWGLYQPLATGSLLSPTSVEVANSVVHAVPWMQPNGWFHEEAVNNMINC